MVWQLRWPEKRKRQRWLFFKNSKKLIWNDTENTSVNGSSWKIPPGCLMAERKSPNQKPAFPIQGRVVDVMQQYVTYVLTQPGQNQGDVSAAVMMLKTLWEAWCVFFLRIGIIWEGVKHRCSKDQWRWFFLQIDIFFISWFRWFPPN